MTWWWPPACRAPRIGAGQPGASQHHRPVPAPCVTRRSVGQPRPGSGTAAASTAPAPAAPSAMSAIRPAAGSTGPAAPGLTPHRACHLARPGTHTGPRPTTATGRSSAPTPGLPVRQPHHGDHRADAPGTRTRPQQRSRPGPSRPAARTGRGRTRSLPGGSGCAHCQHSPDQHEPPPNPKRRTVPACAGLRTWPTGHHRMLSPQQTDTTPKKAGTDTISNHTRRTLND